VYHEKADAWSDALRGEYRHELNQKYGEHAKQFVEIYYPKQAVQNAPVAVYVHGGGGQNFPARFAYIGRALLDSGVIFIAASGRRDPDLKLPDEADDIEDALAWVADNIRPRGGNPDKLYLIGHSHGAMISSEIAFKQELIRHGLPPFAIKGVVLFGGTYALETRSPDVVNRDSPRYTPNLRDELPHLPPHAIVVAGTQEQLPAALPEARALVKSIQDKGGSAELFELEGIEHFHTVDSLAAPDGLVFLATKRMIGL
jgi:acetyl esterase/lipase